MLRRGLVLDLSVALGRHSVSQILRPWEVAFASITASYPNMRRNGAEISLQQALERVPGISGGTVCQVSILC